jgi:hypothetical protein
MPDTLRINDAGPLVIQLQFLLNAFYAQAGEINGVFDSTTEMMVKDFQAEQGLTIDGVVGPRTWQALSASIKTPPTLSLGNTGEIVRKLQHTLNLLAKDRMISDHSEPLNVDGIFGPRTQQMVQEFQHSWGLSPDGIVGPRTWGASLGIAGNTLASLTISLHPSPDQRSGSQPESEGSPQGFESVAYDNLVHRAFAEMIQQGRLLFNPPDRMQLGKTERVEVRLTRTLELDADLLENLRGRGDPQLEEIPTAPLMAVTLKGDSFHITAYSDEEQNVTKDAVTSWEFEIRALERGQQRLAMCVSLRIPVPGQPLTHKSVPVREATIDVQVGAPALVGQFMVRNWQWFIGTAIAIAAVVVAVIYHLALHPPISRT